MANVQGIALIIRAFLPTGKTIQEQHAALTLVTEAHASGDYSAVLAAAQIGEVKAEQRTRRMDDAPPPPAGNTGGPAAPDDGGDAPDSTASGEVTAFDPDANAAADAEAVPDFIRSESRRGRKAG